MVAVVVAALQMLFLCPISQELSLVLIYNYYTLPLALLSLALGPGHLNPFGLARGGDGCSYPVIVCDDVNLCMYIITNVQCVLHMY